MANVWLISPYPHGQFPATRYPASFASDIDAICLDMLNSSINPVHRVSIDDPSVYNAVREVTSCTKNAFASLTLKEKRTKKPFKFS